MHIIIDIFNEVITDQYLPLLFVFILCVMALMLINVLLGTIIGSVHDGFNPKKWLLGVVKIFAVACIILAFGFVIDFFVLALNRVPGVEISTVLVTIGELVGVVIAWGIDLSKEVIEKIKGLKELKFIKYEDVKVVDMNVSTDDVKDNGGKA